MPPAPHKGPSALPGAAVVVDWRSVGGSCSRQPLPPVLLYYIGIYMNTSLSNHNCIGVSASMIRLLISDMSLICTTLKPSYLNYTDSSVILICICGYLRSSGLYISICINIDSNTSLLCRPHKNIQQYGTIIASI